jgi:hypothetical protein
MDPLTAAVSTMTEELPQVGGLTRSTEGGLAAC